MVIYYKLYCIINHANTTKFFEEVVSVSVMLGLQD